MAFGYWFLLVVAGFFLLMMWSFKGRKRSIDRYPDDPGRDSYLGNRGLDD